MTVAPKTKTAPESDTQDEIDKIMSEIEDLQKELASADSAPAGTSAADEPHEPDLKVIEGGEGGESGESEDEPSADAMGEFHASEGDVSMEETLGDLKEEEPSTGNSLLDQIGTEQATAAEESETNMSLDNVESDNAGDFSSDLETEEEVEQRPVRTSAPSRAGASEGALTMTLTGNMTLSLKYDFEGEEVIVGFTDHTLKVQLSDGTEFKIPVRRRGLKRAA
ncbi:MAG: hypothetical protein A2603_14640 [Bdellovibrionales bacterium RIFOXYD1_FULL_55_31]|nr:MAG: hypothetical protein A2603_14640 [Bdellovibrionales bacterium RIFOXYD1_FULL_55_31]